jgi:transcriptional regulator with GAF, ATPase, and Fis domain
VLAEAECVAKTDSPVLLLGETGTGKEPLAETIHEMSARRGRPMVVVNSASLPAKLVESELFGREAGAYTGAATAQIGRFAAADGSTLFLDEIGDLPVDLQSKLLRVLEGGRFERLGRIPARTIRQLQQYAWPGNIRELRNIVERGVILATGDVLQVEIPQTEQGDRPEPTLQESERDQILAVLQQTGWRIRGASGAAAILGLKATTLEARMAKLQIKRPKSNSNTSYILQGDGVRGSCFHSGSNGATLSSRCLSLCSALMS